MKNSECIKIAINSVATDSNIDTDTMVDVLRGLCRLMDDCEERDAKERRDNELS